MKKYSKMLSKKDAKILEVIKGNCRLSTREISEKTGIPITTIHNRIKKLEKDGIIKYYKAVIDNKKIGKGIQAFIDVTCNVKETEEIIRKLTLLPMVEECYMMTGVTDIIIKVSTSDIDELNNFITKHLQNTKGVEKTLTSIILNEIPVKKHSF